LVVAVIIGVLLGVRVPRGHERREQRLLLLVMMVMVGVEHLAERTWVVDVIAAQVTVRPVTPFPIHPLPTR